MHAKISQWQKVADRQFVQRTQVFSEATLEAIEGANLDIQITRGSWLKQLGQLLALNPREVPSYLIQDDLGKNSACTQGSVLPNGLIKIGEFFKASRREMTKL